MSEATEEKQLSDEDQARVDKVTSTGVNATERSPFRPGVLLGVVWLILIIMGLLSYWIASDVGVV